MADAILSDSSYKGFLPSQFLYACSGASYQIEGGWNADGKGVNVWDNFLKDKENGEIACDSYNLWKEDIKLLKKYGCNAYRFSIGWARIFPDATPNEKGIAYYSNLIDALLAEGIEPCVTIFHWDHPAALETKYDGFRSRKVIDDFVGLSKVLFERLGDRVKTWITINEPHIFSMLNSLALKADNWVDKKDNATFAENLLLCHAKTVDLYRKQFQSKQKGKIGITLNCDWSEPIDDSNEAKEMAQIYLDYVVGLFADPIFLGKFPETILKEFGEHAPKFSDEEWKLVKGSNEFFGLNHYGTAYTTGKRLHDASPLDKAWGSVERVYEKDGQVIGLKGENGHPYTVPWGFGKLLHYLSDRYTKSSGLQIFITENGFPVEGEADLTIEQATNDPVRQAYYSSYLKAMFDAMKDGVDVGGYMAWSLLDNLEWVFGYRPRFGLTAVDRENGCKRYPKKSALMLGDIFSYAIKK